MPKPNIKLYLILSGVLAVILLIIVIIPLNRRPKSSNNGSSFPTPTTIDSANQPGNKVERPIETKDFTGVEEEALPAEVLNQSGQKQDLRYRTPLTLTTFTIDFDYAEDKFIVNLSEPKDVALKEFEEWKKNNYSFIPMDQFIFN